MNWGKRLISSSNLLKPIGRNRTLNQQLATSNLQRATSNQLSRFLPVFPPKTQVLFFRFGNRFGFRRRLKTFFHHFMKFGVVDDLNLATLKIFDVF